jgi:hypothetical protein
MAAVGTDLLVKKFAAMIGTLEQEGFCLTEKSHRTADISGARSQIKSRRLAVPVHLGKREMDKG